jgi:hypothetical protein
MKQLFATLMITISLMACKKDNSSAQPEHEKANYKVFLIGKGDTTAGPIIYARTETVGIAYAEDDKLRVDLIGYNGHGVYTLQVTNKQNCSVTNHWGWEGLAIDSISPGGDTANVLLANQVKTYTLTGSAKEGKIKVQAKGDCGNSSTLIIYITTAILPIHMTESRASYDKQTDKTTISFNVETPADFDWILIQKETNDHEWVQAALIANDYTTKNYSIKL